MRLNTTGIILSGLIALAPSLSLAADAKAKVTYQDQVSAIFKNRCNSCHNADKQKGGLNLETYSSAMQGGGSGKVVEPGDPDSSTLYQLVTHSEQPNMPPNAPKLPDAELGTIKAWIEGGALEASGSMAAVKAKPKFEFKLDPNSAGKPVGPPAMPENLATEPVIVSAKPNAVIAMASSPWAPLVAVGGHKQVLLYQTTNNHLVGVIPFPEGTIHVLKFSRNGGLLLAGGGRGGQSGIAVAWDVKTGKRVFEIGKEYDSVLAADISPDHGLVALGGPSKILRVYNTADGQLVYESKKHTEWVTALEFSPDGVLLASGDRNNGLVVWEAVTGREFYDLRAHTLAITDISWRLDSNVVASASEDGTVRLWEMEGGTAIKNIAAHPGGVASVRFGKDGRLVTTGRDRMTRVWDPAGAKQRDLEAFNDLALEAVFTHDSTAVIGGDWSGEVRVWDAGTGVRRANLVANPAALATRLEQTIQALAAAEAAADVAAKAMAPLTAAPTEKAVALAAAQQALKAAEQAVAEQSAPVNVADQAFKAKDAARQAAAVALAAAQAAAKKATDDKGVADKAVVDRTAAEKLAQEAFAAAGMTVEKAKVAKAAQQQAIAEGLAGLKTAAAGAAFDGVVAGLTEKVKRSTEIHAEFETSTIRQAVAQVLFERAGLEKAAALKGVETVTAQVAAANAAAEATKQAEQVAITERATAEAALNAAKTATQPAIQAATAVAVARKADLDRVIAEKAAVDKALADSKAASDAAAAKVAALKAERDALALEKKTQEAARASVATNPAPSS
ncbi:WD-40 repeat-containing protein [Singulisphaera sp. GP187]|uniref:c-type cytochrome domain-containing protein n=1 Tax=Singulisphaera sp. GP187 TaxID=1882752 RepID=UPI00092A8B33|nr:c-type cytochrome domain-containing protein [Singulisphaera sp. GP187]SIN96908.1 WD-40 repeat-containing protein [Singulisphaera sp. GP187]